MANHNCSISDAEISVLTNPTTAPDFLNTNYSEPVGKVVRPWLSIKIFVGDTAYEFNWFYEAGSAEGEEIFASRGLASFMIRDTDRERFNLPFMPVQFQYVEIWDLDEVDDEPLFSGTIQAVRRQTLGKRKDGTPLQILIIECEDDWGELENDTYNELYENKRAGYILRDAFSRAGFDVSEIDPNFGPLYDKFPVNELSPADVASQILGLLDYTYRIHRRTKKVYIWARDAQGAEYLRIDEQNWHKIFDRDFEIQPDYMGYANRLILEFTQKWSKGLASFQYDSDIVLGYTGLEDWYLIPNGDLSIENALTGAVYRINKNHSDNEGGNEWLLEQKYKDPDDNDAPYIVRGSNTKIVRRNSTAIEQMAALKGGRGVVTKRISYANVAMTREEAKKVADFELAIASRGIYSGSGNSDSHRMRGARPSAGQTIFFDLQVTKGVRAAVRIESWRWKDLKTKDQFGDRICNGLAYALEFTPSVSREQVREIAKESKRLGITSDEIYIFDNEQITNVVAFKDCVTVIEPLKEADPSIAEFEDSVSAREVTTKTYYFAPATTHPDSEAFFTGLTHFSNFS